MKPTPISLALPLLMFAARGDAISLQSGGATLDWTRAAAGFGVQLRCAGARFEQPLPLAIQVVDAGGAARWIRGAYRAVTPRNGAVQCAGEVVSPHGTHFRFLDSYRRDEGGFELSRRVEIAAPSPLDAGFASRFGLSFAASKVARDCDILMPGIWYRDNKTVPPKAFGANADYQVLMIREDRLALPLILARDKSSHVALSLERVGGNATTFATETGRERLIDERFQVGAIGWQNAGHLQAAFDFPATEDERAALGPDIPTAAAPDTAPGTRFAPRSHPVKIGVVHAYTLHFGAAPVAGFPLAVENATIAAIGRAHPPVLRADLGRVYGAGLGLLDAVIRPYNGTVSVPFQLKVPGGEVKDTSMQMGFVGMALPSAALLLREGLRTDNADMTARAVAVLDFWAQQSGEPSGVPKTWADFPAPGRVTWRRDPTHLRVASDGMKGILRAWQEANSRGLDHPDWLLYARSYGDFLVRSQNPDGSWFGSADFDGTPHSRYLNASAHPIPFLFDLAKATGDAKYGDAAKRAGQFCYQSVHLAYAYVGGTPDNPNVTDKEAGMLAVDAFLALFDATGERRYLDAARQAAIFCETWVYWRDLPIPAGIADQVFPSGRSTVGISLIATGHSASDNYMAAAPFNWYRIYLATGDPHFLFTARVLLHDTKQIMDLDGKLGYKYLGLMPEAMSLAAGRGHGIAGWLPWLTVAATEPLVRLEDTFGSIDIDQIERLPLAKRRALSAAFAATRGF